MRRTKAAACASLGLVLGSLLGIGSGALTRWSVTPFVIVVSSIAGFIRGRRIRWDHCSDSGCLADLAAGDLVCHRCGGLIKGTIRTIYEDLEARERLEMRP